MRLYRRHQTWWIRYQQSGRCIRVSTHLHDRAAAEGVLHAMEIARGGSIPRHAVESLLAAIYGVDRPQTRLPLAGAWSTYEEIATSAGILSVTAGTLRKRRARLDAFVAWVARERPAVETVEAVDGSTAAAYAAHLAKSGRADKTRLVIVSDLSTIWTTLEKSSSDIHNPWRGLRPRVNDAKVRPPFTPDEERAVMAAAEAAGHGWPLACLVARHTGLRYGDVATLEWSDVDLQRGVIALKPRKTARHGVRVSIPIERHALLPALAEAAGSRRDDEMGRYVLPEHATYYQMSGHSKMPVQFADVLRAAGVDAKTHTFHSWRHTLASRMGEAGVGAETRKRILGHTTDEMAERYDHADHLAEQADAIAAASGA